VDDPRALRIAKRFALGWGLLLTIAALLYRAQGTPVVVLALSIASFTYGALLGGFFLGILWRRARQADAIAGMVAGIVGMSFLGAFANIAWPWYVLIGTTLTMLVGIISSGIRMLSGKTRSQEELLLESNRSARRADTASRN